MINNHNRCALNAVNMYLFLIEIIKCYSLEFRGFKVMLVRDDVLSKGSIFFNCFYVFD